MFWPFSGASLYVEISFHLVHKLNIWNHIKCCSCFIFAFTVNSRVERLCKEGFLILSTFVFWSMGFLFESLIHVHTIETHFLFSVWWHAIKKSNPSDNLTSWVCLYFEAAGSFFWISLWKLHFKKNETDVCFFLFMFDFMPRIAFLLLVIVIIYTFLCAINLWLTSLSLTFSFSCYLSLHIWRSLSEQPQSKWWQSNFRLQCSVKYGGCGQLGRKGTQKTRLLAGVL